ncbi:MAG: hypothetical protein HUJ11_04155 [Arenibacter algicola]|jgi:hypothetical protein|uniref:Uncharacterized protein n=1 Tax=Arenibacter algicola TaxID=616991 RepID=A0A221V3Y6_9FLAO|nr:hypothetical protein [Arenibacter algicola]ASO08317.1 hypothetical protein AREALGSMS7_04942 [Arenibacter algicola]MBD3661367.1 hypothetical protein [Arenibacter algicola]HCO82244.1 hypothetical protein [Arenibacter sp.]|tara:strand:+ start:11416 stop:11664 length:249 start_codon:yes stop_codon:yes gene_type:complete
MADRQIKLIWDFRGESAQNTAKHHKIHLEEYVLAQNLTFNITGNKDLNNMHSIAYLVVSESEMIAVRDALKPHRGEVYTPID